MSIGYFLVLKKAGLKKWTAVVPFLAERELSTVLFKRMRTFYRSFAIAAILMLGAIYLGPKESKGWMFTNIAAIVYELFLIRFYFRLSKAFGKKKFFTLLLVLFPVVFLPVLGLGKATFARPDLGPVKQHGKVVGFLLKGRPVVVPASGSPKVEFKAIEDGDYIIGGVLTDVYQRKMTSKIVNVQ
jgi:hypothetical protein